MRTIDADALLDEVMERHCKECDKRKGIKNGKYRIIYEIGDAPCRACDVDDFTDELENAPTIEPEPQWIPCSERLPKDEIAYYLVTLVNHGLLTYGDIDIARWDYDRRKGKESWHWCKEREVIAWMPLPEPYTERR